MKKILFSIFLLPYFFNSIAQDKTVEELKAEASKQIKKDPNDTVPKTWKKGGLLNINFNQSALSNWAAGGENSTLALTSFFNAFIEAVAPTRVSFLFSLLMIALKVFCATVVPVINRQNKMILFFIVDFIIMTL